MCETYYYEQRAESERHLEMRNCRMNRVNHLQINNPNSVRNVLRYSEMPPEGPGRFANQSLYGELQSEFDSVDMENTEMNDVNNQENLDPQELPQQSRNDNIPPYPPRKGTMRFNGCVVNRADTQINVKRVEPDRKVSMSAGWSDEKASPAGWSGERALPAGFSGERNPPAGWYDERASPAGWSDERSPTSMVRSGERTSPAGWSDERSPTSTVRSGERTSPAGWSRYDKRVPTSVGWGQGSHYYA